MARPSNTRINPLREGPDVGRKVTSSGVSASPVDQTVVPSAGDSEFANLIGGLASLNPALGEHFKTQLVDERGNAKSAFETGAAAGAVDVQELNPLKAIELPEAQATGVDPAYSQSFQAGYKAALGQRMGAQLRDQMLQEWQKNRGDENFDAEGWIKQFTQQEFQGVQDPALLTHMVPSLTQAVSEIRTDARALGHQRMQAAADRNIAETLTSSITFDQDAATNAAALRNVQALGVATNMRTRSEVNEMALQHLQTLSEQNGGDPEVFQALREKDPTTGKSPVEMDVGLNAKVTAATARARSQMEQRLAKAQQGANTAILMQLDDILEKNPEAVTNEQLIQLAVNNPDLFSTERVMSLKNRRDTIMLKQAEEARKRMLLQAGLGGLLSAEDQKKSFEVLAAPATDIMVQALGDDRPEAQGAILKAASVLVEAHTKSGLNVPNPVLKGLFDGVQSRVPGKDAKPDAAFKNLAAIYQAIPAHLRPLYMDASTSHILESYNTRRSAQGADESTAYAGAYKSTSPEARRALDALKADPEFRVKVRQELTSLADSWRGARLAGNSWWDWVPGARLAGLVPTNGDSLATWGMIRAEQVKLENPDMSAKEVVDYVRGEAAQSWVIVPSLNQVLEVPPQQASEAGVKALDHYVQEAQKRYPEAAAGGGSVGLRYEGNGTYSLWATKDGVARHRLDGEVSWQDIQNGYRFTREFTPDEGKQFADIQGKLRRGEPLDAGTLNGKGNLLAKAKSMGLLSNEEMSKITQSEAQRLVEALSMRPKMNTTTPNWDGVEESKLPNTADKAKLAQYARGRGDVAGALTIMGEGVVLKTYPDPSKGTNIGIGYNIDQNKKTVHEDFRRAGIPVDQFDNILAGKVSITLGQAYRLYQVVQPRYEGMAKAAVERVIPDAWHRLGSSEKAVLTDLAYQVGNADKSKAVKSFDSAVRKLLSGDVEGAAQDLGVSWSRREDGTVVWDGARNNLRSHMLHGQGSFDVVIAEARRRVRKS